MLNLVRACSEWFAGIDGIFNCLALIVDFCHLETVRKCCSPRRPAKNSGTIRSVTGGAAKNRWANECDCEFVFEAINLRPGLENLFVDKSPRGGDHRPPFAPSPPSFFPPSSRAERMFPKFPRDCSGAEAPTGMPRLPKQVLRGLSAILPRSLRGCGANPHPSGTRARLAAPVGSGGCLGSRPKSGRGRTSGRVAAWGWGQVTPERRGQG